MSFNFGVASSLFNSSIAFKAARSSLGRQNKRSNSKQIPISEPPMKFSRGSLTKRKPASKAEIAYPNEPQARA